MCRWGKCWNVFNCKQSRVRSNEPSWLPVKPVKAGGTEAERVGYYVRFEKGWSLTEIIVDSGESEIPLSGYSSEAVVMEPGVVMGKARGPLEKPELEQAQISKVHDLPSPEMYSVLQDSSDASEEMIKHLDGAQRVAFKR